MDFPCLGRRAPLKLSFGLFVLIFDEELELGHESTQKGEISRISPVWGPPGFFEALCWAVRTDY